MRTIHALDFYLLKDLVTGHSGVHFDRVVEAASLDDDVAIDCDAYFILHLSPLLVAGLSPGLVLTVRYLAIASSY
jgi:hypothetical protein